MLFNSFQFVLLFLPVVALVYAAAQKFAGQKSAQAWLLLSSLFFYGYGHPSHLPLLLASVLFNWATARVMDSSQGRRRKLWLQAGLVGNLAFLSAFKYANFFLRGIASLHGPKFALPDWEFPLGISFFTLTQVMYLVDCYQGLGGANSLFDQATFASMFPYVTSGPLVRARAIVPQLKQFTMAGPRIELACRGFYLFAIGLVKKVVFADAFANVADAGFHSGQHYSTAEAWIFGLAYTFQIYFDFSGYSDMALGAAWMLGIDIPQNFNAPYRAKSISEFWQRWHISLSNFITNYLYTPLLRAMPKATLRNAVIATIAAMAIAGLWHGPAWTFIIFGVLHGVALATNQVWKKRKKRLPDAAGWLLTFIFVVVAFIFFRSPNVSAALAMLRAMLPHAGGVSIGALKGVLPVTPLLVVRPVMIGVVLAFFFKTSTEYAKQIELRYSTALAAAAMVLLAFFFMNSTVARQFVYFAF